MEIDEDRGRAVYVHDPDGNVVELWTWDVARRADEGSFLPATNPVVMELHLPPPWGAPERDSPCDRCERTTRHYGRRLTSSVDDDSDRAAGTVFWFCADCGHRHKRVAVNGPLQQANDDTLTEWFDRH